MVEQKNTLIVDSGVFVALASKTDSHHEKILSVIKRLDDREISLVEEFCAKRVLQLPLLVPLVV
jgi:predicted nucleic acid-binding protein